MYIELEEKRTFISSSTADDTDLEKFKRDIEKKQPWSDQIQGEFLIIIIIISTERKPVYIS